MIYDNYNFPTKCPGSGKKAVNGDECPECGFIWTKFSFKKVPTHGIKKPVKVPS